MRHVTALLMTELMLSEAMRVNRRGYHVLLQRYTAGRVQDWLPSWARSSTWMISHTLIFLEKTIGYIPETISCRYNPGGMFKISNDIMDNPGDAKYGMTTEQLFEAFKILKAKGAKAFRYPCIPCKQYRYK